MESFNFFIFRLKHLRGLSNYGLLKVMAAFAEGGWQYVTASEVAQVAQIKARYRREFDASWQDMSQQVETLYSKFQSLQMLTFLEEEYPAALKEIYNPPAVLFYQGDLSLLAAPSLAVVGSREATTYGLAVTARLVPELVAAGLVIVSGLARGIDTAAHKQAISRQGRTIGVIGSGFEHVYPKANRQLQTYLSSYHLVLTEYLPDSPPLAFHFPARNRIIAGISLGTCIIEANARSGSLITAQLALEAGREVFAVPGNILKQHSLGTNELIQAGAKSVATGQDILAELRGFGL